MGRDMISELPDTLLLHIMSFMNTKYAVQTCVLSKRWNHLCKRLINLTYSPVPNLPKKIGIERFKKFASWVLSSRDHSCSLHNLGLHLCWTEPELLDKIIKYALFCNVQQLILDVYSGFRPDFQSLPLIFCSQSLTSLELSIAWNYALIVLPKSLHMPVLKNLHLQGGSATHELFSTCNLSFLEAVNIDVSWNGRWAEKSSIISSNIMRWLQVLANVKKLTFTSGYPFQIMLHDFSNPISVRPEPPSLVRLESLKVVKHFSVDVSDKEVNTLVEYLLRGSPMAKVHITRMA
ncbi:hypothetical protein V8G54_011956 [Vigna mungo]|uniref:F-box domain-containing protein n=1 Tax=Vigna mungo TaxID=3915 RepID=A0AAQ3NR79_VIGMU